MATLLLLATLIAVAHSHNIEIDPKGYVMFCPCMGRFGNQADQYLGAINFAKNLDRTLVLPPWVEYRPRQRKSTQIPFNRYFKVEAIQEYHKAITMEEFMSKIAPSIWPAGKRTVFCYQPRGGAGSNSCKAKDGNPFAPFWDTFGVDFEKSEFFGPLFFNTEYKHTRAGWNRKYPAAKYPVLAFAGPPGKFPVRQRDVHIQKYFKWSDDISNKAEEFIKTKLTRPFIGIHFRNGVDWERACEDPIEGKNMFASAQCLGYNLEHGKLTKDLCFPPKKDILDQIKETAKKLKAKAIFVASDNDYMISEIKEALKGTQVTDVVKQKEQSPHVDLAILAQADHMIGNCVSTFTAFASRERLVNGNKPTTYHAFKPKRDEL